MKTISLIALCFFIFLMACNQKKGNNNLVIAKGKMPNIVRDRNNNIHIVYGSGDSIMYISSKDGISFTTPALIAVLLKPPGRPPECNRGPRRRR